MAAIARSISFDPSCVDPTGDEQRDRIIDGLRRSLDRLRCGDALREFSRQTRTSLEVRWPYESVAWSGHTSGLTIRLSSLAFDGLAGLLDDAGTYLTRTLCHELAHVLDGISGWHLSRRFVVRTCGAVGVGGQPHYRPGNRDNLQWSTTKNGRLGPEEDFADSVVGWAWGTDYEAARFGAVDAARLEAITAEVESGGLERALLER